MKSKTRIAIGADHRGYALKEFLTKQLTESVTWIDVGAHNDERSDYPVFAIEVCQTILRGDADCGVLLCGTGVGMSITANRFSGIYAGLAWNTEIAQLNKEDDNANVLVLPADYIDEQQALSMLQVWLQGDFKHKRYEKRIAMIDTIDASL